MSLPKSDHRTRITVLVALAANLVIAAAKAVGGLLSGSPALLSEAAHSVPDTMNETFLLAALRRSRRPADAHHPSGYGKERYFWSLLAAVGISDARDQLIGESADPALRRAMERLLSEQAEIDNVAALLTMRLGPDSVLVAAGIDPAPGIDSEEVERVSVRIKTAMARKWPPAEHIFLDITNAPPRGGV